MQEYTKHYTEVLIIMPQDNTQNNKL